jgi:hypothetical protein
MDQFIVNLLRIVALTSGSLFCYGAAFMYENEEAKVQNILENWWIRVDDLRRLAVSRHSAITRTSAEFAGTVLDRIFGKKIISFRVIAVAGCLSLTSLHLVALFVTNNARRLPDHPIDLSRFTNPSAAFYAAFADFVQKAAALFFTLVVPSNPTFMYIVCIAAMLAVIISAFIERLYWLPLLVFYPFASLALALTIFARPYPRYVGFPYIVLCTVAFGVVCDVIAIALSRILLRWQADWTSMGRTFIAAIVQLVMSIALMVIPIAIGLPILNKARGSSVWWWPVSGWAIMLSSSTNLLSAVVALAFFGAAAILLIHRLLWPFITRPMYRLARGGLFRSPAARTALFSLGVALILIGLGKNSGLLFRILSIMGAA